MREAETAGLIRTLAFPATTSDVVPENGTEA
jgi:hypothetical protein